MHKILFGFILFSSSFSFSQSYFQQKVEYSINVTLNDEVHTLSAFEEFNYTNNAPCALDFIYIHIWPNAYKNNKTALAKQLYRLNQMDLENASQEERGYIDSLDFKVDGDSIKWEYDSEHIDIVKLYLNKPVNPGETILISTPFKVKIPSGQISRLGHIEESYQITQWYPKPAVYDRDGWHQMPYLNQGEFYSEYGSFDVSITLPKNYVVGATGDLQTESEMAFLNDIAEQTKLKYESDGYTNHKRYKGGNSRFPKSDTLTKTIRYTQQNVHDFAWFADKRFNVLKGEVELPHSKRKVTSWAMFVPHHATQWEDAIEYINDGTFYYSKWNGDYQYNQVTAVDGTISAGGGMEYPNVTVIGNASSKRELEVVIVHEVGHNWFYGMLGSNERTHPWMDEGLNTLNEMRYIATKYPQNTQLSDMMRGAAEAIHLEHLSHHDMSDLTYSATAGSGIDQPIELHSDDYTSINYGGIVYSKTGLVFTYLKDYLGDELFDKCMQAYFDKWHFKHPQPQDFRQVLEEVSGKNLSWVFDDIIPTTKQIDFKLKKVRQDENGTEVTIKNIGHVDGPVRIDAYSFGKHRNTALIEPGQKKATIKFPERSIDEVRIDGFKRMPEVNRKNNNWHKGLFGKIEPINFEFLAGDNESDKSTIWVSPIGGYNIYDNIMLGIGFHNYTLPRNKIEYVLAPMFSIGRKNLSGMASIRYGVVPSEHFKMIMFGLKAKTFGFHEKDGTSAYIAISPYINFDIGKPKKRVNYSQTLKLQGAYNIENTNITQSVMGGFAKYQFYYSGKRQSFQTILRGDYIQGIDENIEVVNSHISASYSYKYHEKQDKKFVVSAYFGKNLLQTGAPNVRYGLALGGQSGTQDVFYENYMFARSVTDGLGTQRRNYNHGNFNTVSTLTFGDHLFTSNLFLELPYVPLIGIFGDYGAVSYSTGLTHYVQAGIGIRVLDGNLGVYMPLYESENIVDAHIPYVKNIWQKIRFTVNLSDLSAGKLINNLF